MVFVSSHSEEPDAQRAPARFIGLTSALLIGVNLRPAITTVAATLDEARRTFELSAVELTVLATLPVIAFGLSAPLGPWLARRFSVPRVLLWAMYALAAGLVLRVLWPPLLLPGTFIVGVAIMVASTLLPQFLKSLDASGVWVGLSSMSFGAGAALGAAFVSPISAISGNRLDIAWGVWAVLALVAAVSMLIVVLRLRRVGAGQAEPGARLLFAPRARGTIIALILVFGLQALLYFAVTAWMPLLLVERGYGSGEAGWLLAWFSIVGFVPTLLTPIIARRRALLLWFGPALGVAIAVGMAWLYFGPVGQIFWAVSLLGVVQNAAFGLGISLIVTMSVNPRTAGVVSAIAQGAGFALAGAGSLGIGLLHTASGSWMGSFLAMSALGLAFGLVAALAARREAVDLLMPPGTAKSAAAQ